MSFVLLWFSFFLLFRRTWLAISWCCKNEEFKIYAYFKKKQPTLKGVKAATQFKNFSLVSEQGQKFTVENQLALNYLTRTHSLPSY